MRTTCSSSHLLGVECVCLSAYWDTLLPLWAWRHPHGCGPGDPPARPLNFPPGCGPGDPLSQPDPSTSPMGVGLETPPPDPSTSPGCGPGDPLWEQNSWHTLLKILPCPNFVAGGKNRVSHDYFWTFLISVNWDSIWRPRGTQKFRVHTNMNPHVGLLRLFPSITAQTVRS